MKPPRSVFTKREWAIVETHRTPRKVQRLLNSMPYNAERDGTSCRSFRGAVRRQTAHCLEASIIAATILEQHGYPSTVLSLESQDNLDHVLFVYRQEGRWGAISRSRAPGLGGRKPVFRSIRDLVLSYYDPFIDHTARITGYGLANLCDIPRCNWRFSRKNVWKAEKYLISLPHKKLRVSTRRYRRMLKKYREFRQRHPSKPLRYYSNTHLWM